MKIIDEALLTKVSDQAKTSKRKRQNYNFHETLDANVQRMLNALEPGTYVRPHKHEDPDKAEGFILLKGKILVAEFDSNGQVVSACVLSHRGGVLGVELSPRTWHTIVSLEPGSVIYEVKDGPYSPLNDKNFASWAPEEGDSACSDFLKNLLARCGIDLSHS